MAARVIGSLRTITKVLMTARITKAKEAALAVWVLIWPAATPVWITTSENSLIWARLIAGSRLARKPCFSRYSGVKVVITRLITVNAAMMSASPITEPFGIGIVMPSATKNSVMKKSRSVVTFAVTSSA